MADINKVDTSLSNEEDNLDASMQETLDEAGKLPTISVTASLSEGNIPRQQPGTSLNSGLQSLALTSNQNVNRNPSDASNDSSGTSHTSMEVQDGAIPSTSTAPVPPLPPLPPRTSGPTDHQARSQALDEVTYSSYLSSHVKTNLDSNELTVNPELEPYKDLLSNSVLEKTFTIQPSESLHSVRSDSHLLCSPSNSPTNRRVTRALFRRKSSSQQFTSNTKKSKVKIPPKKPSDRTLSKLTKIGSKVKNPPKPAKNPKTKQLDHLSHLFKLGSPGLTQLMELSQRPRTRGRGAISLPQNELKVKTRPPVPTRIDFNHSGNRSVGKSSTTLRREEAERTRSAKSVQTEPADSAISDVNEGAGPDLDKQIHVDPLPDHVGVIHNAAQPPPPPLSPVLSLRQAINGDEPLLDSQLTINDNSQRDIFNDGLLTMDTMLNSGQSQTPISPVVNRSNENITSPLSPSLLPSTPPPPVLAPFSPNATLFETPMSEQGQNEDIRSPTPPPPKRPEHSSRHTASSSKEDVVQKLLKLTKLMDFKGTNPQITHSMTNLLSNEVNPRADSIRTDDQIAHDGRPPQAKIPTNLDDFYALLRVNPFLENDSNNTPVRPHSHNTHATNHTNSTNSSDGIRVFSVQERLNINIFPPALSLWRDLRNTLSREVTLQLRLSHYETMLANGLYPTWSVNYTPPNGLLSNNQQVESVVDARRRIARIKLETTILLTRRELEDHHQRSTSLKTSLTALYGTNAAREFSMDTALQGAIQMANRTRLQQYAELCKRLDVIRLAPEEALWQDIPDQFPRPANAVRPPAPAPVQQPSSWANQAGQQNRGRSRSRPRGRSQQRGPNGNNNRGRGKPDNPVEAAVRQELEAIRRRMRQMEENQSRNRNGSGKGKGVGKKSNKRFRRF